MEFNCKIDKNFWSCFNEARGVALFKRSVLNSKKKLIPTYLGFILFLLGVVLGLGILFSFFTKLKWLFYLFFLLAILIVLSHFFYLIEIFYYHHKLAGKTIIDEKGITNNSYRNITIIFNWNKIKAIVITKHAVTILTDTPYYFFFSNDQKEELLKVVKKQKKEKLVLDYSQN